MEQTRRQYLAGRADRTTCAIAPPSTLMSSSEMPSLRATTMARPQRLHRSRPLYRASSQPARGKACTTGAQHRDRTCRARPPRPHKTPGERWLEAARVSPGSLGDHHRGSGVIQFRCIPAVMVPFGRNAGRIRRAFERGFWADCSRLRRILRTFLARGFDGTISDLKWPGACAAAKRCCERTAQRSCSFAAH